MTGMLLQSRKDFSIGPFHVWGGEQLIPHKDMIIGHAHEQPHLMVLTRPPVSECPHCKGHIPQAEFIIRAKRPSGEDVVRPMSAYDVVYIKAGTVHSVEQVTPGALGGFACIFPAFDERGNRMDDPKREADPRAKYGD